jgi:hypothetical protein
MSKCIYCGEVATKQVWPDEMGMLVCDSEDCEFEAYSKFATEEYEIMDLNIEKVSEDDVCEICENPATRRFVGNPVGAAILTCEADLDQATADSGQGQVEDLI